MCAATIPRWAGDTSAVTSEVITTGVTVAEEPIPATHRGGQAAAALFLALQVMLAERRRWLLSALALGVVSMLVFYLEGVNSWMLGSATAYLDNTPGDIVAVEPGIDDLLFQQSSMPDSAVAQLRALPGVAAVTPVVTAMAILDTGAARVPITVVGYDPASGGGPWEVTSGSAKVGPGEAIVDRGLASMASLSVGRQFDLLGHRLRVAGVSSGTNAAGDFFVFTPLDLAQSIAGGGMVSYVFLRLAPGADAAAVSARASAIPGVHALARSVLSGNDRAMIQGSFAAPVNVIAGVGLVAGVLIAAIVLLTAIVHHSRDYALLRAIGSRRAIVYGSTVLQSVILSVVGIGIGFVLAVVFSLVLDATFPIIATSFSVAMVLELGGLIVVVNTLASLLPIRHIQRLDPQEVFKA